ncbi:hypothetical protein PFICI_11661 [Pestalotiopsis fici W106-1]|uniref:Major facilitator superfamily (MFS) profile domain-containing protein n=1 Tax=Pestalotiopsis fici (strain W106-1 / CGMCC3.15140) TaxID=1229662 RepID=W3WR12_PESFW|nr:uncharacterized protein PFICI_11661 [Pestalotiopsis fici W106-1]ETS76274.1 hypothetical protein PFICI_11661 [Pestalotiopsis fici W106-1]
MRSTANIDDIQPNTNSQLTIAQNNEKPDLSASTEEQEQPALDIVPNAPNLNEVTWDGPDDLNDPRNWSVAKRAYTIAVVMCVLMSTSIASSAIAPGIPQLLKDFHSDDTFAGTLVVSIELLGFGFGPLFFAPMSELYGRHIVYNLANVAFCLLTIGCALAPSLDSLVALRFLQGLAASCSSSHGGGTIGDLVPAHRRGAVTSGYTCALLFGPTLGPIFGAYLTRAKGWRWVFWAIAVVNTGVTLLYMFTCRETYGPVLLKWKAKKLRKETGNPLLRGQGEQLLPAAKLLRRSIIRPTRMLFLSPIVAGLSLYIATVYGQVYLLFSTFSFVFTDQYGFTEENNGLTYLGLAIGMLISLLIAGIVCDRTYQHLTKKYGEEKPEYRLETLIWGAIATPIGLLIYGWTAQYSVHPATPIFATSFVGFGVTFTFIPIQVYLIDAYTKYAASATAAASVLRAIAGALLPSVGLPMYHRLGLGWGNTLLAFIAIGLSGLPLLFLRVGEKWRTRFPVELE